MAIPWHLQRSTSLFPESCRPVAELSQKLPPEEIPEPQARSPKPQAPRTKNSSATVLICDLRGPAVHYRANSGTRNRSHAI